MAPRRSNRVTKPSKRATALNPSQASSLAALTTQTMPTLLPTEPVVEVPDSQPFQRSSTPEDVTALRAQAEANRNDGYEAERQRLRREIAMQSQPSVANSQPTQLVQNEPSTLGTDPRIEPLARKFSSVKVTYLHQILTNTFDPLNITKLRTEHIATRDEVADDKTTVGDIKCYV